MATRTNDDHGLESDELLALARRDAEAGRLEEALRKLKGLIAAPQPLVEALPVAARIYAQLGLAERAQSCYRKYLDARPEAVLECFELGMTHFDRGEHQQADEQWRAVLEREPVHPPALFYSGLLAAREGRLPDAQRHLDVLVKSVPEENLYAARGRELLRELESRKAGH